MKSVTYKNLLLVCFISTVLLAITACQRTDNSNTNLSVNANTTPVVNANSSPVSGSTIVTREPEQYRATLVLSAETEGGEKTIGIPSLTAEIARNGADRRVAFKLPDGSDLIYLETGGKHIVVAPGRKQYAELTPEATGVQLQKLMTPGQIASYLDKLKGVERVGEETFNGRTAEKYRYASTANTSTSAGQVSAEAFVYVDKETGLPLRSELYTEATGDVKGVTGAKIVAEMRDINTTVDPAMFQVPPGMNKVAPEQVRAQIESVTKAMAAGLQLLMSNMNTSGAVTTASPAATASPSISPTPRTP
jgi:hypothetical protein